MVSPTARNRLVLLGPTKADANSFRARFQLVEPAQLGPRRPPARRPVAVVCRTDAHTRAFSESHLRGGDVFVSFGPGAADGLLRSLLRLSKTRPRLPAGRFLAVEPCRRQSLPSLSEWFAKPVGAAGEYTFLPRDELAEVLSLPAAEARALAIGASVDETVGSLTVLRGDLSTLVVPLSTFRPSGTGVAPDFSKVAVTDYGNAIEFGDYGSSTDAILYEFDAQYRKALRAKRRAEERTFGASLRRLRTQRRLKQSDFGDLAAKTIARVERDETQPHSKTLRIIADRLGIRPEDIESY